MISHKEDKIDPDRIERLEKRLEDWGAWGDYDSFDAWLEYQNKHVLPYGGGYLEQPLWIREAFKQYNLVWNFIYATRHRKTFNPQLEEVLERPLSKLWKLPNG